MFLLLTIAVIPVLWTECIGAYGTSVLTSSCFFHPRMAIPNWRCGPQFWNSGAFRHINTACCRATPQLLSTQCDRRNLSITLMAGLCLQHLTVVNEASIVVLLRPRITFIEHSHLLCCHGDHKAFTRFIFAYFYSPLIISF